LEHSQISDGPIFRRIFTGDNISAKQLSAQSVNHIVKKHVHACELPSPNMYCGHSLRRGLANAATKVGVGIPAIMRQGRWKSVDTVMEYIEEGQQFDDNTAGIFLIQSQRTKAE